MIILGILGCFELVQLLRFIRGKLLLSDSSTQGQGTLKRPIQALSLIWLYKIFQTRYELCTGKDLYSSTTPPRPLRLCLMDTLADMADNPIVTILDPSTTIV